MRNEYIDKIKQCDCLLKKEEISYNYSNEINLDVKDLNDLFDTFAPNSDSEISTEAIDYLIEKTRLIKVEKQLKINVLVDDIKKEDEKRVVEAIRNGVRNEIFLLRKEARLNNMVSILMLVLGLFVLSLGITIPFFGENTILNEALVIASWVFLWRAIEGFFLEGRSLKLGRFRLNKIFIADINFKNKKI